MTQSENLLKSVKELEKNVITDGYLMSLGEIINLYKNEELIINPKYQRIFRWSKEQKSKLIESLILGVPLPGIFVAENEKGAWEIVDGLQRISTILEFMGELQGEEYIIKSNRLSNGLSRTLYLNSLEGIKWTNYENKEYELPDEFKLKLKRTRIYVSILKNTGDVKAKYDLFQRLNTGGSTLSPQEVRNCLIIDKNEQIFDKLIEFSANEKFRSCINLIGEQSFIEKKDVEMVLRYLSLKLKLINRNISIGDMIDNLTYKLIGINNIDDYFHDTEIDLDKELEIFKIVFNLLEELYGDSSFINLRNHRKQIIYPAFDVIASGIGFNIGKNKININTDKEKIKEKINQLWNDIEFEDLRKEGNTSETKLKLASEFGKKYFNLRD